MAKLSSINKNNKRIKLADKFYKKREKLKKIVMDKKLPLEERFKAHSKNCLSCRETQLKIE
jgi:small subunit ribosomal protein S14